MSDMRTTVNIRPGALELCKKKAAETGQSLGEVISEAILQAYSGRSVEAKRRRYDLPAAGEGGVQPGVDLDDTSALQDLMDELHDSR